jgi:BirA family biotin operon repressor/biotin-[acetyl-CoA-carboxylase] ligase
MANQSNNTFVKIINTLSDGQFHDGDSLGHALQITRSAVWKAIKKLDDYDIAVNAVKGKGYALLEPLHLLDAQKIKKKLNAKNIDIRIYETIDSTITPLKIITASEKIQICLAEHQTQARGRLNRQWYSPFGKNIYFSGLFRFKKDISELSGLSLVVGLALFKALSEYPLKDKLSVKWPNDIMYDHQKLAGVLIDIQAETHGSCQAIISFGLNVNMRKDKQQAISQAWTSLLKILGHPVDRNALCVSLINHLMDDMARFDVHGFAVFMEEWIAADGLLNRAIAIDNRDQRVMGVAKGVNAQGQLLLALPSGQLQSFSAGDTSLSKTQHR